MIRLLRNTLLWVIRIATRLLKRLPKEPPKRITLAEARRCIRWDPRHGKYIGGRTVKHLKDLSAEELEEFDALYKSALAAIIRNNGPR